MKKHIILTSALAALFPLAAFAQSPNPVAPQYPQAAVPPAPPAPPAPPRSLAHLRDRDSGPKEPVTYLGVETSGVPRVLSEQMGLPRGFGVVVDYVAPDSPAAAAGLLQSDIIRMLNDQIILEPGQLGKLVRSYAEGATINLTVLRKGTEVKLTVTLKKHDVSMGHGGFNDFGGFEKEWNFDDFPKMNFDFQAPDMTAVRDAVRHAQDEAKRAGDEARKAVRSMRIVTTTDDDTTKTTKVDLGNATISLTDDEGNLKLEKVNGRKTLSARDKQGKVLFEGPIDTEEQRAKIPAKVRERFEKLEDQELPEVPPAPEPPKGTGNGNESVKLQNMRYERAALSPQTRTGWVRSTMLL